MSPESLHRSGSQGRLPLPGKETDEGRSGTQKVPTNRDVPKARGIGRDNSYRIRKPLLYPAELRDHYVDVVVVRVAVNQRTSSLRQHARNRIGISGVKPPQALVMLAFSRAHAGARGVSGNISTLLEPEHGNERRKTGRERVL